MSSADDLTSLYTTGVDPGPAQPMAYRQGTVVTWNPLTAQNTVLVGGTVMADLPILNTSEARLLGPGAKVGLMVAGRTTMILGRITIPGTPEAATALEAVAGAFYIGSTPDYGERATAAWADPTGTGGPVVADVPIGRSGKALVIVSATIATTGPAYMGGGMSYVISGATTRATPPAGQDLNQQATNGWGFGASRVFLEEGLNTGLHTFTAKYRSVGVTTVAFQDRVMVVIAL